MSEKKEIKNLNNLTKVDFKKKELGFKDDFISKTEVHSILSANFGRISDHWFRFSTTWNYNAYQTFMDMDKYLILIYLVQKSFRHYADILIIHSEEQFYTKEELAKIVTRSAGLLEVKIDNAGANEIANRSRGTPRIANRLLRRVRDYSEVKSEGKINKLIADDALKMLDVDLIGLDLMDRSLLLAIVEKFSGGPVGLDNIAAAIGEEKETIEDVIEPYLIQQGYLMRSPRGRLATPKTYEHFGLKFSKNDLNDELWKE